MKLTLTPEIEDALRLQAQSQGTTPEELALEALRKQFVSAEQEQHMVDTRETMRDFLDGYIGVIHSGEHVPGGARLSENTGDEFTQLLVEKRKRGRR